MELYDPETIELKWQDAWERERAFYQQTGRLPK